MSRRSYVRLWRGRGMAGQRTRRTAKKTAGDDLLRRLQGLLYEYHDLGRFEEAKPHILWLMEIAASDKARSAPV